MSFATRLSIIVIWPLVAIAAVVLGRQALAGAPEEMLAELVGAHKWLGVITGLYVANFLLAWRYAGSWPVTLTRSLLWGLIAYLCLSFFIDIGGNNWADMKQILGGDGAAAPQTIASIRAGLAVWGCGLAMSATCIAIGFERQKENQE